LLPLFRLPHFGEMAFGHIHPLFYAMHNARCRKINDSLSGLHIQVQSQP